MEQYEKLTDEQLIEKLHSGDRDVTDYLMENCLLYTSDAADE